MHGYIEPFYDAAEPAKEPGHFWLDQPVYLPARHGLKISRVNPENDHDLDYEIVGRTADTFDHPPVHSLKLSSDEALVVTPTKKDRPVIVLGGLNASEVLPSRRSTRHDSSDLDIAWAVPVYGGDQYEEATRESIRAYDFRNYFYLPEDKALGFDEGFARLDHAQPVAAHLLRAHLGLKLSSDALDALREWFVYFATGLLEEDSMILDYRREQGQKSE